MVRLICGIAHRDGGQAEPGLIHAMLDAMNPLGKPTLRDVACEGPAGLGVIALSPREGVAPEPARLLRLPGAIAAVDARLYGEADGTLEGTAAADRLAAARHSGGAAAIAALHGDFAYAWWERETGDLELGRDQFGVRPLVYAWRQARYVAFASHPSALLGTGLVGRELDGPAMVHIMRDYFPHADHTAYSGMRTVRAAHLVHCAPGLQPDPQRYWRLPIPPRRSLGSDPAELAAGVRQRLEQAVRRRLPAAGPGAAEVSGGLDSSPIAVIAARCLAEERRSFFGYCLAEDGGRWGLPAIDEVRVAREAAAAAPNMTLTPVPTPGLWALSRAGHDPDTLLRASPEDPVNALLADAAAKGAPVVFTGFAGDQLVTHRGRGALAELFWSGAWGRLWPLLRRYAERRGGTVWSHIRWRIVVQSLPLWARRLLLRPLGRIDSANGWVRQISPFLARDRHGELPIERIHDGPDTQRNRRSEIGEWLVEHRLASHAWQASVHGLAYVAPMVDRDLIEFSLGIPGWFYAQPGSERSLYREAIRGLVPESVRQRPDKWYPVPLESYRLAKARQEIIDWLDDLKGSELVTSFVDLAALKAHLATLPDVATVRRQVLAAAARGEQPEYHDGQYESVLRFVAILAQHDGLFRLAGDAPARPEAGSGKAMGPRGRAA